MISLVKKSANALASVAGDSLEGYSLSGVLWSIFFTVVDSTLYIYIYINSTLSIYLQETFKGISQ